MTFRRLFATLALAACISVTAFAPSAVAAPADNFAEATPIDITGTRGVASTAYLDAATRETGEPTVPGSSTDHTVWWRYTATATGYARISTCRPNGVNPVPGLSLGVYTGGSVDGLTPVAQATNNCPSGYENAVINPFPVTAGNYYWLQIGAASSISAADADFQITIDFNSTVPTNDNWANATTISGSLPQTFVTDNGLSTVETNEPFSDASTQRQTLWWKWTAAADGVISVDTCSSSPEANQDSTLTVFSGTTPADFTQINEERDFDFGCGSDSSPLTKGFVPVSNGVTYWIKLANVNKEYGFPYTLQIKQVTTPDFAEPPTLASGAVKLGNLATGYDGNWSGWPSISTTNQWRRCDAAGANCVNIASATGYTYTAQAADLGKTLRFSQTGSNGSQTTYAESAPSQVIDDTPTNDNWINAFNLGTGSSIDKADDNNWAGTEGASEPSIAGFAARNSVWYRWTPAVGGNYFINNCLGGGTVPDSLDLMIGIRSGGGTLATTVTEGGADNGCGPYHSARTAMGFFATAGTTYWIQVASKQSAVTGSFRLQINPVGDPVINVPAFFTGTAAINQTLFLDRGDWMGPTTAQTINWFKCDASGVTCTPAQTGGVNFTIPQDFGGGKVKATFKLDNLYGSVTQTVLSDLIPADSDGDGVNDDVDGCVTDYGNKPNGCPASQLVPVTPPDVTGNYIAGQTLTSSTPLWNVLYDPDNVGYGVGYKWQRCTSTSVGTCTDIPGATSQSYVLGVNDLTYYIRVVATALNPDDQDTQASVPDGPVASPPSPPQKITDPTVTGTPIVGLTLGSTDGTWTPAGGVQFDYRWLRCDDNSSLGSCSAIGGATASSYTLVAADLGKYIRIEVTGSNVVDSDVGTSNPTAIVTGDSDGDGVADVYDTCVNVPGNKPNGCPPSVITPTAPPAISGSLEVGQTISSSQGGWSTSGDPIGYNVDFQWQLCDTSSSSSCSDIVGQTSNTYVLAQGDYAKYIRVRARAYNTDDSKIQDSNVEGPIVQTPGNISPPVVSGTTIENETLTTTDGIWVPFDNLFSYQWQRCTDNVSPSSCTTIPSQTDPTYVLTAADIGSYIRSRVTATNGTGSDSYPSAPTSLVTVDTDSDNDGVDDVSDDCPTVPGSKPNGCDPSVLVPATAPAITATNPEVGVSAGSTPGTWTEENDNLGYDLAYQWESCGSALPASCSDIGGATAGTYTPVAADYGNYLRLRVTASNADDADTQTSAMSDNRVSQQPTNDTAPSVSGTALEGRTLTGDQGTWTPGDSQLTSAWQRCDTASAASCSPIPGETGSTYVLTAADVGKHIRLRVDAVTDAGNGNAISSDFGPILGDEDGDGVDDASDVCLGENGSKPNGCDPSVVVADSPPEITGALQVGQTLTSDNGAFHPIHDPLPLTHAHQWERCDTSAGSCSDIAGATDPTYTLATADYGKYIRVTVTASNADDSEQQSSLITDVVSQVPSNSLAPSLSGTAIEGYTLTGDQGTWTPADAQLDNEWLRCDDATPGSCAAIPGATASTYTLTASDVSKYIRLRVTASTIAGGDFEDSAAAGPIQPDGDGDGVADASDTCPTEYGSKPNGCDPSVVVADTPPAFTGTLEVGQTLTSDNGGFHPIHDPLSLTYAHQWERCDTSAGGCSDIAGATDNTYTLATADYGKYIRVTVTASNADDSEQQSSPISSSAVTQFPTNSTAPSVSGTATVGQTLTGLQGTWQPGDAGLANSWQRCDDATLGSCSPIGATGATYTLVAADEGKRIRLTVTATTDAGSDSATSPATAPVILDDDADGVPDGADACLGETGTKPNGCLPSDVSPGTTPVLSGTFEIPQTISTDNGTFNMDHDQLTLIYSYKWQVCTSALPAGCSYIPGENSSSLTLTPSMYGKFVRSEVTATNTDDSASQFSDPSQQIWEAPVNQAPPTITGIYGVGNTLTAHAGTWTPAPPATALSHVWMRCDDATPGSCTELTSETGSTYLLTSADLNKFIRVRETGTTPIGVINADSDATVEIVADSDGDGVDDVDDTCPGEFGSRPNGCDPSVLEGDQIPVISGDLTVGQTLSTTDGHWLIKHDPLDYDVTYQWQSCTDSDPSSCADLPGHVAATYTLQSSDYGHYMRVVTTATNADDVDSQFSDVSATMVSDVPTNSSPPSITGSPRVSEVLTGDRGTWEPADTTFDFQWLRCADSVDTGSCTAIAGETASTYTLTPADDGSYIRFRVHAQTTSGDALVSSGPTAAVFTDSDQDGVHDADDSCPADYGSKPNGCEPSDIFNVTPPVITGTLVAGQQVSVSNGTWDMTGEHIPLDYAYEWLICSTSDESSCNGVPGETGSTFTIPTGIFGNYLRANVIVSNSDDSAKTFSALVGPTDEAPYKVFDPAVNGTAAVGQTLTAYDGEFGPSNISIERVWLRCDDAGLAVCSIIAGETGTTYTLTAPDYGKYIAVRVRAWNSVDEYIQPSPTTSQVGAGTLDTDGDNVLNADDTCPTEAGDGRANGCPPAEIEYVSDPTVTGTLKVGQTLTAVGGGWLFHGDPLPNYYDYAWDVCATNNPITCSTTGSTGLQFTPTAAHYKQYVRVTETVANTDDTKNATSAIYGPIEQDPSPTVTPAISGTPTEGQTLSTTDGVWSPADTAISYSWFRCDDGTFGSCSTIAGASGSDYTLTASDVGKYIRSGVIGTTTASQTVAPSGPSAQIAAAPVDSDGDGVYDGSDSCPSDAGDGRPNGCPPSQIVNDTLPAITGTAEVGQTLTAQQGTWHMNYDQLSLSYALQWQRCTTSAPASCTDIPSQNGSTYDVTTADYGKYLRLVGTASNADDVDPQGSALAGPVVELPSFSVAPTITGTAYVGQTLTAQQGTWAPFDATLDTAWMRCSTTNYASCTAIPGETGSTYTLAPADDGYYIRIAVTGTTYASVTTASAPTAQVAADPGPDTDGDGVYDSSDACVNEAGTKPNGCLPSVLSSNTLPSVSGTPNVGQTLTGDAGTWTILHDQIAYGTILHWQRCDTTNTASCSDIGGATGSTYTVSGADYGKRIRLQVTASNSDDNDVQSSPIGAVVSQVPAASVSPSISGTPTDGQTLTGSQGSWAPADAALANSWLRCDDATPGSCSPIGGQIGTTYTLTPADIGKYIRFRVSATTTAATTPDQSAPLGPVAAIDSDGDGVPDSSDTCPLEAGSKLNGCDPSVIVNVTAPTISGTLQDGSVLSSTAGTWNVLHDPLGYTPTRQWQRCDDLTTASCSDIPLATGSTYTATPSDIGKYLRVVVTASNPDDTAVQASAITATAVVVAPPPANVTPPDISGTAQVGQLLSTGGGTWTLPETVLTYEWLRCDDTTTGSCAVIPGATSAAYQLTSADLNKFIRVRVTGTANAQSDVAVSNPTNQIAAAPVGGGPTTPVATPVNPAQILGPKKNKTITVRMNKKGQIYISRVSVYCMMESTGDCSGAVSLKARVNGSTRSIGGFKLNTLRGGGRTLRIKLSSAARRHVRAHSVLRASLKVTYKSPGVSTSRYSATVKIKA